jgi:NAD-dependent SIR2 family protein deacetylase
MTPSEFIRTCSIRGPRLMWFVGAGASAAAGVPTAYHLTWEFKRLLFCSEQRVPIQALVDLADPAVRSRIQQHLAARSGFPPLDSDDEYAFYFESAYPSEADRRALLEKAISGARPSFGHMVMAALMRLARLRVAWTTNFDPMVEDAAAEAFETTGSLTTAAPETAVLARQALTEDRFPLLVKLHGDFRSRRLRNTEEELRAQDAELRRSLVEACGRFGLVVVGYSGRDTSVMEALREALSQGRGYPSGLFWLHRQEEIVRPAVRQLIGDARAADIEAELVPLQTFDEMMGDLLGLERDVPTALQEKVEKRRLRVLSNASLPATNGGLPVLRMNALPVVEWPSTCRLIDCEIGGTAEVRQAVKEANAELVVARRKGGVLAFGSDAEVHRAFDTYQIKRFDLHTIEAARLRYDDSAELGLLYDALVTAVVRHRPLVADFRRWTHRIVLDVASLNDARLAKLKKAAGGLTGSFRRTTLTWVEAVDVRLEYRLSRLWLVLVPSVAVRRAPGEPLPDEVKDFIRERTAKRYNRQFNEVLAAWSELLVGDGSVLLAFAIGAGVDAAFRLAPVNAFSRRRR